MTVSEETLKTIKEKGMHPRPRWQFLIREDVLWGVGILCLLLGAVAVAVMLYVAQDGDWDIYREFVPNRVRLFFEAVPVLWVVGLVIFAILAVFVLRTTRRGYRFAAPAVVGSVVIASLVLGGVIHAAGGGRYIHNYLTRTSILYRQSFFRERFWMHPGAGLLAGEVQRATSDGFTLKDRFGNTWKIVESSQLEETIEVKAGDELRIMGVWQGDATFYAQAIMPWEHTNTPYPLQPPRKMRNRPPVIVPPAL